MAYALNDLRGASGGVNAARIVARNRQHEKGIRGQYGLNTAAYSQTVPPGRKHCSEAECDIYDCVVVNGFRFSTQDWSIDGIRLRCSRRGERCQPPGSWWFAGIARQPGVNGRLSVRPANSAERHHAAGVRQNGTWWERGRIAARRLRLWQHNLSREKTASFDCRCGKFIICFLGGVVFCSQTHALTATTWVSRYKKGEPIWISLKQETVSGSGISWAICKSAPCSRQITMAAPHHSVFLQAGCPSCRLTNSVKALKACPTQL